MHDIIRRGQDNDGGFRSLSSPDPNRFASDVIEYRTSFVASHILMALCASSVKGMDEIKSSIVIFLLKQISETGSVNYWARGSMESQTKPYPDDLDDTACAIAALAMYDKTLLDGALLGKFVQVLVACEEKPGGPYRTWLVGPDANPVWRDVDAVVNANLAYALSLLEIELGELDAYLKACVLQNRLSSPYYPNELSALTALSRRPVGLEREICERTLAIRQGTSWGNPLADAQALGILLRLHDSSEDWKGEVERLLSSDSILLPYAFCTDPSQKGVKHYCGAAALTAAIALELASLIEEKTEVVSSISNADRLHAQIVAEVKTIIGGMAPAFAESLSTILEQSLVKDSKRQITLTPYVAASLLGDRAKDVSEPLIIDLGIASVFGWMAYTLFDDVMDGDRGSDALPLATACLRNMQSTFDRVLPKHDDFHRWQMRMMNRVDASNAWELAYCRIPVQNGLLHLPKSLPSYREDWMLYGRSIGHAIGPVGIVCSIGAKTGDQIAKELLERYCELIAVKQLHDDAHDWEEDLFRGQINSVGAKLLAEFYRQHPHYRGGIFAISEIRDPLRLLFWNELLPDISNDIISRCERSIIELESSTFLKTPEALVKAFRNVAAGAKQALDGRNDTLAFLKTIT
jgi:hypothetical protein